MYHPTIKHLCLVQTENTGARDGAGRLGGAALHGDEEEYVQLVMV